MKTDENLPVLLFVFANEKKIPGKYLRKLTLEKNEIRDILKPIDGKLCKVIFHTEITAKIVKEYFDDYQERIILFHFAGHADRDLLFMETEEGESTPIRKAGLIPFLSRQKGLQLVFFNGCSTQEFADSLMLQSGTFGPPVVMGTHKAVQDDVARAFATNFYTSISKNIALKKAYEDARDIILSEKKTDDLWRGLALDGRHNRGKFPWQLKIADGAEKMNDWCLAFQSGDPLFDLRLPASCYDNLPDSPFLKLLPYGEQHAAVFYSRDQEIRKLYNAINDVKGAPVILFFGASGSGKSSVLDAGFRPRLKEGFQVLYERRNKELGLKDTLEELLKQEYKQRVGSDFTAIKDKEAIINEIQKKEVQLENYLGIDEKDADFVNLINKKQSELEVLKQLKDASDLAFIWKAIEGNAESSDSKIKPLLIILDQVEEAFTNPLKEINATEELAELVEAIASIFGIQENRPKGKVILGFRKEYLTEIEEALKARNIERKKVPLPPFQRENVIAVIRGLESKEPTLKEKYGIQVEPGFPEFIADQLLVLGNEQEQKGPLAPVLQILLDKMWQEVKSEPERIFNRALFGKVGKGRMIWMGDFLEENIQTIYSINGDYVSSGLLLDLLRQFVTTKGTSAIVEYPILQQWYAHQTEALNLLLNELSVRLILLERETERGKTYRLVHDSLARPILDRYESSNYPGQEASRILKNIGSDGRLSRESFLTVVNGERGRVVYDEKEKQLIEENWKRNIVPIVRDRVSRNKLKEAFEYLKGYCENHIIEKKVSEKLVNETILLMSRVNRLKKEVAMGKVLWREENREGFKIVRGFLDVCDQIELINRQQIGKRAKNYLLGGEEKKCLQLLKDFFEEDKDNKYTNLINNFYNYWIQYSGKVLSGLLEIDDDASLNKNRFLLLKICNQFIGENKVSPGIKLESQLSQFSIEEVRDWIIKGEPVEALYTVFELTRNIPDNINEYHDEASLLLIRLNEVLDFHSKGMIMVEKYYQITVQIIEAVYNLAHELKEWIDEYLVGTNMNEENTISPEYFRAQGIQLLSSNQTKSVLSLIRAYLQHNQVHSSIWEKTFKLDKKHLSLDDPFKDIGETEDLEFQRRQFRAELRDLFFELVNPPEKPEHTDKQKFKLKVIIPQFWQLILINETKRALNLLLSVEKFLPVDLLKNLLFICGSYNNLNHRYKMGWVQESDFDELIFKINSSLVELSHEILNVCFDESEIETTFSSFKVATNWVDSEENSINWKDDLLAVPKVNSKSEENKAEIERSLEYLLAFSEQHQLILDKEIIILSFGYHLYQDDLRKRKVSRSEYDEFLTHLVFSLNDILDTLSEDISFPDRSKIALKSLDSYKKEMLILIASGALRQAQLLSMSFCLKKADSFKEELFASFNFWRVQNALQRKFWINKIEPIKYHEAQHVQLLQAWNIMELIIEDNFAGIAPVIDENIEEKTLWEIICEARHWIVVDRIDYAARLLYACLINKRYGCLGSNPDEQLQTLEKLKSSDQKIVDQKSLFERTKSIRFLLEICSTLELDNKNRINEQKNFTGNNSLPAIAENIKRLIRNSDFEKVLPIIQKKVELFFPEFVREVYVLSGVFKLNQRALKSTIVSPQSKERLLKRWKWTMLEITGTIYIDEIFQQRIIREISNNTLSIKDLKTTITKGKVLEVLILLRAWAPMDKLELFENNLMLLSRHIKLNVNKWLKVISEEEYQKERNQITHALFYIIDELQ